ncbi:MAG: hypothetical protein SF187_23890 [Deltaproteobacteria bacterium]|nr:hypothetical protein [Deltaproteobacteria bacterium]
MSSSVGALCDLLEDLAQGPGLPPEALYAQLNPWVLNDGEDAPADRDVLLPTLAAMARRDDPLLSHLTSLAIGYLGGDDGFHTLASLILDSDLPATHRESAADAVTKHHGERLQPHTAVFDACMLLQTQRVLRLVAEGNREARSMLETIVTNTAQHLGMRDAVEPLIHATKTAELPLATVWGDMVATLQDEELRRDLIMLIARDRRVESAEFLAALEGQAKTTSERKELRKHLHVLRGHGIKVPAKASKPREPSVLAFGVDGDACASIFFFLPEKMGGTMVSFALHLTSGIRDGFVREGLSWSDLQQDQKRFLQESDLAGRLSFENGVRVVQRALEQTAPAVLQLGDVNTAVERLSPHFLPAGQITYPPPDVEPATDADITSMLDSEAFSYWFFESVETTMAAPLAKLVTGVALGEQPTPGSPLEQRFLRAADEFLAALLATAEPVRVVAMLKHQALVLAGAGRDGHASLCSRLAADMEAGDHRFLRTLAERSLLWAMNQVDETDEWGRRYEQCHAGLRQVLQDAPREVTKQQVAQMDLGAQIATALIMRNRRLPSAQRAGVHSIETAAFEMAEAFIEKYAQKQPIAVGDFETTLHKHQILPPDERPTLAKQALYVTREFVSKRCDHCVHQCLKFPGGSADGLLFAAEMPWQVPATAVVRKVSRKDAKLAERLH